jgi:tRNA (guanine37-N1)-methyltransferase
MIVEKKAKSYKEIVEIPEDLKNILPTSFDIIGDIALLKIPDELQKYKKDIADAFLKTYKNIKTVCEIKPVSGELRTRTIKIIGGEKKLETIHKEYNVRFKVNVEKTYFSPRLANERKKIADTVRKNEVIVDMFAGVAPFPIIIAKHADPKIIYAIEKNKDAVKYAKENIKINNLLDKIEVIHTDAKNTYKILSEKNVKADRIIMNLPFSAYLFFEEALKIAGDECIIHYFDFLKDTEIKDRIKQLKNIAEKNNVILTKTVYEKIKSYSPREFYIRIDITAKKT